MCEEHCTSLSQYIETMWLENYSLVLWGCVRGGSQDFPGTHLFCWPGCTTHCSDLALRCCCVQLCCGLSSHTQQSWGPALLGIELKRTRRMSSPLYVFKCIVFFHGFQAFSPNFHVFLAKNSLILWDLALLSDTLVKCRTIHFCLHSSSPYLSCLTWQIVMDCPKSPSSRLLVLVLFIWNTSVNESHCVKGVWNSFGSLVLATPGGAQDVPWLCGGAWVTTCSAGIKLGLAVFKASILSYLLCSLPHYLKTLFVVISWKQFIKSNRFIYE